MSNLEALASYEDEEDESLSELSDQDDGKMNLPQRHLPASPGRS
jgi:hypothetical protein